MAARVSIAEQVRRDSARRSRFTASSAEITHRCDICGRPVQRGRSTSNPRKRHEECRRANYFLAAALRVILERLDSDAQRAARRRLILAANAIRLPRRPDGRFVPAREATP